MTGVAFPSYIFDERLGKLVLLSDLAKAANLKTSEVLDRFGLLGSNANKTGQLVVRVKGELVSMMLGDLIAVAKFFELRDLPVSDTYVTYRFAEAVVDAIQKGFKRVVLEEHYVEPLTDDEFEEGLSQSSTPDPNHPWLVFWKMPNRDNWWSVIVGKKE